MSSIMEGIIGETDKIKGADGKACWRGKRYAGTENGKDKCIPVKNENSVIKGMVDEAKAKQYVKPYNDPKTGEQLGWVSSDGYHKKFWQKFAKDSAIKHAKLNPDEVQEGDTGEFAVEKISTVNPHAGIEDNQFRGSINEEPTTSGPVGTQPGGWRRTDLGEEEQLDEKCWTGYKQVGMKKKGGRQVPNCVQKESAIIKGIKNGLI